MLKREHRFYFVITHRARELMQMPVESQKEGSQAQLREDIQEAVPIVAGKPVVELPVDLYIPPDALQVFLDAFEGPLDLLLYLIRRQNIDILDVKISEITAQYVAYIELMRSLELELAGEYLLMASILAIQTLFSVFLLSGILVYFTPL